MWIITRKFLSGKTVSYYHFYSIVNHVIGLLTTSIIIFIIYWFTFLQQNYYYIKILTVISFFIFLMNYTIVICKNPGVAGREYFADNFTFNSVEEAAKFRHCTVCNIIVPVEFKVHHCNTCGICVIRRNHHCPWIGKCVTSQNMKNFFIFLCSLLVYILFLVMSFTTFLIYVNNKKENN